MTNAEVAQIMEDPACVPDSDDDEDHQAWKVGICMWACTHSICFYINTWSLLQRLGSWLECHLDTVMLLFILRPVSIATIQPCSGCVSL